MNPDILKMIKDFSKERDWDQFHSGENLAKALIIEAAEVLELFQWKQETEKFDQLKEEIADVLVYAILLADCYGFEIDKIILEKLKKNAEKYPVSKAYGKSDKYNEL